MLLGSALGLAVARALRGEIWIGVGVLGWFVILEFVAAIALMKAGRLSKFVERYEAVTRVFWRSS